MTETVDLSDGKYTVVVDTIDDDLATVFFEHNGDEIGNAVIDAETLPETARHANAILAVTITNGEFSQLTYESNLTETHKQRAQDRFDSLSAQPPRDDDANGS
jgi:hypothetical protein